MTPSRGVEALVATYMYTYVTYYVLLCFRSDVETWCVLR